MAASENQLDPVMSTEALPLLSETVRLPWMVKFLPGFLGAQTNRARKTLRQAVQKATRRFDKVSAYEELFEGELPDYLDEFDSDVEFAWRRIAGPNPLSLSRAKDLGALTGRLFGDEAALVTRIESALGGATLHGEIAAGRIFFLDYADVADSLRPRPPARRYRDTRWRKKYLAAPVVLFWENVDRDARDCDLVPLLIQIDQAPRPVVGQGAPLSAPRIFFPEDGMGWRIAKLHVEVADENFHVACGHVGRTHLTMDPFCMATYRQLSVNHPVHVLLAPHLRFTLGTNKAAYNNFVDRSDAYATFYAGTLEELRQIVKTTYERYPFWRLDLEEELSARGVEQAPAEFPYRDDMRLYRRAIETFVREYVEAYYEVDADVADDEELQAWAEELNDPARGAIHGLFRPSEARLATRETLVRILSQVIFLAGPGHASQHFSQMYYYRHPPSYSAAAYAPPPLRPEDDHEALWRKTLPPIAAATLRYTYSDFGDFRFDRFGDYRFSRVGHVAKTRDAVRRFQQALAGIEAELRARDATRRRHCRFYYPSEVPNSINI